MMKMLMRKQPVELMMMRFQSNTFSFTIKGMCYSAFPRGYIKSEANKTCVFNGSDIARAPMEPLWGQHYQSSEGSSCGGNSGNANCRNDLQSIVTMGANVVKLYDWDPRNHHLKFLDYCQSLGLSVLVPVSNYFLQNADQHGGYPQIAVNIPNLIKSFSNADGTDYHPAIIGILISNEPDQPKWQIPVGNVIDFTNRWIQIEATQFPSYRKLPIGHPLSFDKHGAHRSSLPDHTYQYARLGSVETGSCRFL